MNIIKILTLTILTIIFSSSYAQDWNGSSSTNYVYRIGNVSIGGNYSSAKFNVIGTQHKTHFFHGINEDLYLRPGKDEGVVFMDVGKVTIGGVYNGPAKFNIQGTNYNSHFYHGTNENTYIRPGKNNGQVIMDVGNVGIGTLAPEERLHVNGTTSISGNIGVTQSGSHWETGKHTLELENNDGGEIVLSFHRNGYNSSFIKANTTGELVFASTGGFDKHHLLISRSGNVGIGTSDPDAKLTVKGDIHTQEVKVDLLGSVMPDFVFDDAYNLRTLQETDQYIKSNKHLPDIPSAAEVAKNGMLLKEMNLKLLQKVEELTLYLIEQNEKIEILQNKVEYLENKE